MRFPLYLLRWQLSTPVLSLVIYLMSDFHIVTATIVANLIGGLIFFWVDRWIFTGGVAICGVANSGRPQAGARTDESARKS